MSWLNWVGENLSHCGIIKHTGGAAGTILNYTAKTIGVIDRIKRLRCHNPFIRSDIDKRTLVIQLYKEKIIRSTKSAK